MPKPDRADSGIAKIKINPSRSERSWLTLYFIYIKQHFARLSKGLWDKMTQLLEWPWQKPPDCHPKLSSDSFGWHIVPGTSQIPLFKDVPGALSNGPRIDIAPGLAARHGERVEAGGDDKEREGGDRVATHVAGDDEGGGWHHETQERVQLPDGDGPLHPAAPPHHVSIPTYNGISCSRRLA